MTLFCLLAPSRPPEFVGGLFLLIMKMSIRYSSRCVGAVDALRMPHYSLSDYWICSRGEGIDYRRTS